MSDPVLTDEEKDALLEGMSSGEVEVTSNKGPTYADVSDFEIGPRSRIVTNSFPRLRNLNQQFGSRMSKQAEQLLNADANVTFNTMSTLPYSEFCERSDLLSLVVEFLPKPLEGSALLNLDAAAVEALVETFYGGVGNEPARQEPEYFTAGETNVVALFGEAVVTVLAEVWQPLTGVTPEIAATHTSTGVIESVDPGDPVICCEFDIEIADKQQTFELLWPLRTVASLLPVFDGQKRDRDAAEDARWEHSLRARVTDAVVRISSDLGRASMTLGEVAELEPGDIIDISNPQSGTILARNVPILSGRFGVHDGRYAIEAKRWLDPEPAAAQSK